jgi:hypothetical protein
MAVWFTYSLWASRESRERFRCLEATLEAIGRYCPNLTSFRYGFWRDCQEDEFEETVTEKGIIALLRACPKLKVCVRSTVLSSVKQHQTFFSYNSPSCCFQNLELINLQKIGKRAFDYMLHSSN